jgi:hypothetical protein
MEWDKESKPYNSWLLNEDSPACGMRLFLILMMVSVITWDEEAQSWVEITGV